MVKSKENLVGAYAFLIGVVLAVIFGLFNESLESAGGLFYSTLVLIGLIVGVMNTSDRDSMTFLLASLSLVIVGSLGMEPLKYIATNNYVVSSLRNVLGSLLLLFVPATIVVALKSVFAMAKI
ncbi:hypothetical protein HN903_03825 [archaeon]|jgi:hypothetical protein|nr:hypothetical protein [archaeon]MBT7128859.1 hypothetical protein [archaeon]